jgi:Tol biopolymer transport system component
VQRGEEENVTIIDASGAVAPRRLTFGGNNRYPVWLPDNEHLVFQSDREGDAGVFTQRADGTGSAQRLTTPSAEVTHIPYSFSPDGKYLLVGITKGGRSTLWTLSMADQTLKQIVEDDSRYPPNAEFSPDGRWIAYQAGEGGGTQNVFVLPFPTNGTKFQVSRSETTGANPLWLRDGSELMYGRGPNDLVSVSIKTNNTLSFSEPTPVRDGGARQTIGPSVPRDNDVSLDGRSILIVVQAGASFTTADEARVVLNWFEELKQRVPVN